MNMPKPFTKKKSRNLTKRSTSSINYDQTKETCVNMEELMQFEAARQRALAQMSPDELPKPFNDYVPHRVFINYIDNFVGSHLFEFLSQQSKEQDAEGEFENTKTESVRMVDDVDAYEETEDDEVSEEDSDEMSNKERKFSHFYEFLGTIDFVHNPKYTRPEGILELLDQEKKNLFLEKVLTCGFIIYNITSDLSCHPKQIEEARWVAENIVERLDNMHYHKPKAFSKYKDCRTFILISTLMTWAKTKPIDPEDPNLPFTERDFRKRKPHPNYKVHCELEKRIIELGKKYPSHLKTIVVSSGIPYGHEEDILHFYFKMAWQGAPHLPIFKPGKNLLPVIHIDSLSSVVQTIMASFPDKYKYIVAADPHLVKLKEIAKLLARKLGSGRTLLVDKEEAFLYPDVNQRIYDTLTSNINIVPGYIMDNPLIRWGSDVPFNENIPKLISEFKTARGLLPVKIFIHGPPASGKTYLAKRLARYYDILHLDEKNIINSTIQSLKNKIQEIKKRQSEGKAGDASITVNIEGDEEADENEEHDDDDDKEEEDIESLKQYLREIEDSMNNEEKKPSDDFVIKFFREILMSNPCRNKGFVIDGYPTTMENTKALYEPQPDEEEEDDEFAGESKDDEEVQGDVSKLCNIKIMPGYVESLDASDEFLINRVIKLPEFGASHFEESDMCRRLTEFRALNTEENTPLIFYDELDVHPMIYNVEKDQDPHMEPTFQAIINHIGPPRNYEKKTFNDIEEGQKLEERNKEAELLRAQREGAKRAAQEQREKLERWMFLKNQELEMEEKALMLMGMPLRHYLMKYIFPTLTRGLVEVARLRPDDPIDFLSEFLFRENPEGKMFQPNYDEREEKLAEALKEYESYMSSKRSSQEKSSKKSFSTEKSIRSDAVSRITDYKCSLVSSSGSGKSVKSKSKTSKSQSSSSELKSTKTSSSEGICTCKKSPSLSTCSSDKTPSTASSCTCPMPEPCEPCEPCEPLEPCEPPEEKPEEEPCKCPCVS